MIESIAVIRAARVVVLGAATVMGSPIIVINDSNFIYIGGGGFTRGFIG